MYRIQNCCCAVHSSETMLMLMVIAMIWGGKIYSGLGFFDFSIGVIRPIFHRLGMLSVDRFTSLVTYAILIAPKCFNLIGAMLSGPKAFEFLVERIVRLTPSSVNCMLECYSF